MILKELPENVLVSYVASRSEPFQRFYQVERPRIPYTLRFFLSPDLGQVGTPNGMARMVGSHEAHIILPDSPADPLVVAHELTHVILHCEGYPEVPNGAPEGSLAQALYTSFSTVFADPLNNTRLAAYGFDVLGKYQQKTAARKEYFKKYTVADNPAAQFGWVLGEYQTILEGRAAGVKHPDSYQRWMRKQFPDQYREIDRIDRLLKGLDITTRDGQHEGLKRLRARYAEVIGHANPT